MLSQTKDNLKDFIDRGITEIGDHTYGIPKVHTFSDKPKLKIGKFCSIAGDVDILLGGEHRTDWISTYPFPAHWTEYNINDYATYKGNITIGNDVWIGYGVTILSGVTIGDGAVIGAKSVISKDINPYEIVAGNPQRVIRKRFTDEQIEKLLKIKWWEWDDQKIKENVVTLCSTKLENL